MPKVHVITGSTRPGRVNLSIAKWVAEQAAKRDDLEIELVDIVDFSLPMLDEPAPPMMGNYQNEHTKTWAAKVAEADGFIFVTPEYNHSMSAAQKNAIDFLYAEWNNKAAGIVSYGFASGLRAAEHLRQVLGNLQIATVQSQVAIHLPAYFENYTEFKPTQTLETELTGTLDQVVSWANALKTVRS